MVIRKFTQIFFLQKLQRYVVNTKKILTHLVPNKSKSKIDANFSSLSKNRSSFKGVCVSLNKVDVYLK